MWYTLLLCFHDHTSRKGKVESTPLYSTVKLTKYLKNVKPATFLIETFLNFILFPFLLCIISKKSLVNHEKWGDRVARRVAPHGSAPVTPLLDFLNSYIV